MRHGKTTALKCLPLATELLIVFLTADILWQLLCGRPPFSLWGFLLSGGLMTAGNSLFLQKPRRFWQILLLNVLLCAVWIPLLSRTLDLTYPPLLVIQVPLYLFPLCRGYHWGVTPVTVRHLHGAGEYMGLYGLFYLIVASFAPQLLDRVPVLLALLALAVGLCGNAALKHATRAESGDMSEMLSWPIQQLARARLYDEERLTDAEKETIDELMPGEAWACYDPTISDPVKFEFDTQAFRADVKKYVGVWLSVGKKCAGTYLDATMALTYPFFYPYREYRVSGYYVQMGMSDAYDAGWCDFDPPESRSLFPRALASLSWRFGAKGAMQIPVVGWLFNMGVIVWTMLFFALREMYWGRWRRFGTALLPVLLWGTFLLGPVMAGRYIYPFVCALPVLAARLGRSVKEAERRSAQK